MFDCGVWEPVIKSHHELGHYCIFDSHCNMQLWDTLTYCCIELNTEMYSLLLVLQKNWLCSCYISTEFRMQCCCWLRLQLALSMFFACSHWTLLAAVHCLMSFSCAHRQKCKLASALSLILNFQVNKCTIKEKNPTFLNFRSRRHWFSEMSQLPKHYRAFWLFVQREQLCGYFAALSFFCFFVVGDYGLLTLTAYNSIHRELRSQCCCGWNTNRKSICTTGMLLQWLEVPAFIYWYVQSYALSDVAVSCIRFFSYLYHWEMVRTVGMM